MKKKAIISFLFLSIISFVLLYVYTETDLISGGYFNYHVANFVGYVFLWSVSLMILSILGLRLETNKYQTWFKVSSVAFLVSLVAAYKTGDGNGAILSIDGELVTWFLAGIYSFVSVVYFIVQFVKSKRSSKL